MKIIAWLAGFVFALFLLIPAVESEQTGLAIVIFIVAAAVLGPPFFRLKERAFQVGFTGTLNPTPDQVQQAEKVAKWVGRVENAQKVGEWLK